MVYDICCINCYIVYMYLGGKFRGGEENRGNQTESVLALGPVSSGVELR